jgi:hypothetical protein
VRLKAVMTVVVLAAIVGAPVLPGADLNFVGAAYAKNDKGGSDGGNGNGGGGGNGKSEGKGNKDDPTASKSSKNAEAAEAGKMNGALRANISAVLAHIRNGQTTSGPVGLLAGLAVADTRASEASGSLAALQALARNFDLLDRGLAEAGFASVEEYLVIRSSGILTDTEMAVIDPLIAAVGGSTRDGMSLARVRPTEADLEDAAERAAGAQDAVEDAEQAIVQATNKEGDPAALLAALRKKLAPHQSRISAAVN